VDDLAPVLGLFCSKPQGDCTGSDANGQCTDLISGRFGNCSSGDVLGIRNALGLL